jgi:hypothetical protein
MANTHTGTKQQDKGTMQAIGEKAGDIASAAADKAKNLAGAVGDKVDSGVSAVGGGMQSVADTIRHKGPSGGVLGSATSAVASGLDNAGSYLEEKGLSGMAEDVTDMIRRNPIPALLVGVGIGYLLARALRS